MKNNTWQWNHESNGFTYISDNQHITGLSRTDGNVVFEFRYGNNPNVPKIAHRVELSRELIESSYNGDENEAIIIESFKEYLAFKNKFRASVAYDMGEADHGNTINK